MVGFGEIVGLGVLVMGVWVDRSIGMSGLGYLGMIGFRVYGYDGFRVYG